MAADLLVSALARLPLFEGLSTQQLGEIVHRAEHVIYHPGAMIIEENTEGDMAILIMSEGAVRVSGPELSSRLEPIPRGSLIGESAMLIDSTTYGSTVVARGHVRALQIHRDALHALMADDPSVADHLVQNIARRLSHMAEELREIDSVLAGEQRAPHTLPAARSSPTLPAPLH